MPKGLPPLKQASAALRKVSRFQSSALGGLPAGYIACTSIPAYFLNKSMREQGPLIWLPIEKGTACHLPLSVPRYWAALLTLPLVAMICFITSSIGSSNSVWACGHQVGIARMSWPDLAWASAEMVISFLRPLLVM